MCLTRWWFRFLKICWCKPDQQLLAHLNSKLPHSQERRTLDFIKQQHKGTPFFAMLSTPSCHAPWTHNTAPKYSANFSGNNAPRDPAFSHFSQVHPHPDGGSWEGCASRIFERTGRFLVRMPVVLGQLYVLCISFPAG